MENKKIACCFCGKTIDAKSGNNAYPLRPESYFGSEENRCCDQCNAELVIPTRVYIWKDVPDYDQERELKALIAMPIDELRQFLSAGNK